MADTSKHKLYWFLDDLFGKPWNDFKDFIGHPSDPKWIRWLVDNIPGYYPSDMNEDWEEHKETDEDNSGRAEM